MAAAAAAVLALDQLTKWWAVSRLDDGDIELFWTLRLHLARNKGAAFSLGENLGLVIPLAALVVVIVMVWMGRALVSTVSAAGLGLVLGGAFGNLADRAFRDGSVVDFIDLQWWPIFNVADIGVTIGAVVLILTTWREG